MNEQNISAELIMRLRRATGLPVMDAKRELLNHDAADRLEFVIATENYSPQAGMARDPQEDDETLGPIIHATLDAVAQRATQEYDVRIAKMRDTSPEMADFLSSRRGICHRIWHDAKKELIEEHGIDWRTPQELNPGTVFD